MPRVIKIEARPALPERDNVAPPRKKVAAYARVSTDQDAQQNSFEAQRDYYTKLITDNPDWDFAGIYADHGISGTSSEKRPEFNRMLADCRAGKIQMILTKSVSRFARNTVDSLNAIRELKQLGIGILFEKESIFTLDSKGEFLITLMSSLSQEESRSISENVRWGMRKRAADGKYSVNYTQFLGYDRGKDGQFVINPEQAAVVKHIFRLYLTGYSPTRIASKLMEAGMRTGQGNERWYADTVQKKLQNESYKGDKLLQKTYIPDFLDHKQKKNHGEVRQYYVTTGHEPIIEPQLFDHVQGVLKAHLNGEQAYSGMNPISSKMFCGVCGRNYGLRYWHLVPCWQCREKAHKGCTCFNIHIYDYALHVQLREILIRILQRTDVVASCHQLIQDVVADDVRRTAALDFLNEINAADAESFVETDDCLMIIDRITAYPDNHLEMKLINRSVIRHPLRGYSPKTGWHWPYGSKAHPTLTARRKV